MVFHIFLCVLGKHKWVALQTFQASLWALCFASMISDVQQLFTFSSECENAWGSVYLALCHGSLS